MERNRLNGMFVYKYHAPIPVDDKTIEISMPAGAQILCVQIQDGFPQIWARVNPSLDKETKRFRWFATGQPMEGGIGLYVGTIQSQDGRLVFHLFEVY